MTLINSKYAFVNPIEISKLTPEIGPMRLSIIGSVRRLKFRPYYNNAVNFGFTTPNGVVGAQIVIPDRDLF